MGLMTALLSNIPQPRDFEMRICYHMLVKVLSTVDKIQHPNFHCKAWQMLQNNVPAIVCSVEVGNMDPYDCHLAFGNRAGISLVVNSGKDGTEVQNFHRNLKSSSRNGILGD